MRAVRDNRYVVLPKDFEEAYKTVVKKDNDNFEFYK
jgi:26S proteasome regulatory subunit T3